MPSFDSASFWDHLLAGELKNGWIAHGFAFEKYFCIRGWVIGCALWGHFNGASGDDYFLDPEQLTFDPKFVRQTQSLLDDMILAGGESCAASSAPGCIVRFDTLYNDILEPDENDPVTPDLANGLGEIRARVSGVLAFNKDKDGRMSYSGSYTLKIGKDWNFESWKKPNPNFRVPGLGRVGIEIDLGFTHEMQRFGFGQEFYLTGRHSYTTRGRW